MIDANAIPGAVIALITAAVMAYQARVGIRPAERAGFREDFQALVKELREDKDELELKIVGLETRVEELTTESRALGNYTRILIRELRDRSLPVPAYMPPPDLSKHLN